MVTAKIQSVNRLLLLSQIQVQILVYKEENHTGPEVFGQ